MVKFIIGKGNGNIHRVRVGIAVQFILVGADGSSDHSGALSHYGDLSVLYRDNTGIGGGPGNDVIPLHAAKGGCQGGCGSIGIQRYVLG